MCAYKPYVCWESVFARWWLSSVRASANAFPSHVWVFASVGGDGNNLCWFRWHVKRSESTKSFRTSINTATTTSHCVHVLFFVATNHSRTKAIQFSPVPFLLYTVCLCGIDSELFFPDFFRSIFSVLKSFFSEGRFIRILNCAVNFFTIWFKCVLHYFILCVWHKSIQSISTWKILNYTNSKFCLLYCGGKSKYLNKNAIEHKLINSYINVLEWNNYSFAYFCVCASKRNQ